MIKSMTGYGRGESLLENKKIITELRSLNHRYRDISLKLPRRFFSLETQIKRFVGSHTARGKIDVTIQIESTGQDNFNLSANLPLAKELYRLLGTLKKEMKISEAIGLSTLLSFKDIIMVEQTENETNKDWDAVKPALELALQALNHMQTMEGQEIAKDMLARIAAIEKILEEIETSFPQALLERQQALRIRVSQLCEGIELDESRIMQEIALLADRSDITEEIVRAKSHLRQLIHWLDLAEPVGRKLDFLLQEINREVNTMGSKASDADISQNTVLIKNELEKIREQVQNIV